MNYIRIFLLVSLLYSTTIPIYAINRTIYIKEQKKSLSHTIKELLDCKQNCTETIIKALTATGLLLAGIGAFIYFKPRPFPVDQQKLNQDLRNAASRGNLQEAQSLLARGAQVNAQDKAGATALHFAASGKTDGHIEIVKILIKAGADVNIKDKENYTPIREAINPVIVNLLRDAGAR